MFSESNSWRRHVLLMGALCLPIVVVMLPLIVFYSQGKLYGDAAQFHYPLATIVKEAIRQGEWPLWNPFMLNGMPLLADPQSSVFYPAQLLFLMLPVHLALIANLVLHVIVLATGSYVWLRRRSAIGPSLGGALLLALSGTVMWRAVQGQMAFLQALAWVPWIMWCLDRYWCLPGLSRFLTMSGVFAVQILAGFPTVVFYSCLAAGLDVLLRFGNGLYRQGQSLIGRRLVGVPLAIIVASGLTAVQLLPTIELIGLSGRSQPTAAFVRASSLAPIQLITMFLPDILGSPTTQTSILGINWGEHNLYVGGLPILMLGLALMIARREGAWALSRPLILALAFLVLALGAYNPLYRLVAPHLPAFRQLADLGRTVFFFCFFLVTAFVQVLESVSHHLPAAWPQVRRIVHWSVGLLCTVLMLGLLFLLFGRGLLREMAAPLASSTYGLAAEGKLAKLDSLFNTQLISIAILLTVSIIGFWSVRARASGRISWQAFQAIILTTCVIDVAIFSLRMVLTTPVLGDVQPSDEIVAVKEVYSAGERLLPTNAMWYINKGAQVQLTSVTGYDPLIPTSYLDLLGLMRGEPVSPDDRVPMMPTIHSELLQLMNVRYVISDWPLDDANLSLLYAGERYVYQLHWVATRALVVWHAEYVPTRERALEVMTDSDFDPYKIVVLLGTTSQESEGADWRPSVGSAEVSTISQSFNRVAFRVVSDQPGWLVIGDSYYPGWQATVNGRKTQLWQGNLAMRVVPIPAGNSDVALDFQPPMLQRGKIATLSTFMLILLVMAVSKLYARTQHSAGS